MRFFFAVCVGYYLLWVGRPAILGLSAWVTPAGRQESRVPGAERVRKPFGPCGTPAHGCAIRAVCLIPGTDGSAEGGRATGSHSRSQVRVQGVPFMVSPRANEAGGRGVPGHGRKPPALPGGGCRQRVVPTRCVGPVNYARAGTRRGSRASAPTASPWSRCRRVG